MNVIRIYTDTFVKNNPGSAGFGVILEFGEKQKEISKGYRQTSKPRIELLSMIAAFDSLNDKAENYVIEVYTTSKQIVNTVKNKWSVKTNHDLWTKFNWYVNRYNPLFFPVSAKKRTKNNGKCYKNAQNSLENELFIDTEYNLQKENKRLERIERVKNKLNTLDVLYEIDNNNSNLRLNLTYFYKNAVVFIEYSDYSIFYETISGVEQHKHISESKLFKLIKKFMIDGRDNI